MGLLWDYYFGWFYLVGVIMTGIFTYNIVKSGTIKWFALIIVISIGVYMFVWEYFDE